MIYILTFVIFMNEGFATQSRANENRVITSVVHEYKTRDACINASKLMINNLDKNFIPVMITCTPKG